MDIDWSKAPEGATHYRAPGGMYCGGFYKREPDGQWFFFVDAQWEFLEKPEENAAHPLIPRPAKPEPKEWEESIVDRIGELGNQVHNLGCNWQNDEDISEELGKISVQLWELQKQAHIRTQAEREREELVREAAHVIEMKNGSPITLYIKYCEDLYDAGLLRKGDA